MRRFSCLLGLNLTILCVGALAIPCSAQSDEMSEAKVKPMMFKLHMDPAKMSELVSIMHSKMNHCFLEDLDPGDDASLVMICGVPEGVTRFSNDGPSGQ